MVSAALGVLSLFSHTCLPAPQAGSWARLLADKDTMLIVSAELQGPHKQLLPTSLGLTLPIPVTVLVLWGECLQDNLAGGGKGFVLFCFSYRGWGWTAGSRKRSLFKKSQTLLFGKYSWFASTFALIFSAKYLTETTY